MHRYKRLVLAGLIALCATGARADVIVANNTRLSISVVVADATGRRAPPFCLVNYNRFLTMTEADRSFGPGRTVHVLVVAYESERCTGNILRSDWNGPYVVGRTGLVVTVEGTKGTWPLSLKTSAY
ncbi:hypothetical protein J8J14_08565 [Roseomonas sp. SSH11]|uniref:Uncharacterized protein n=1 Tax=Pararoseomonas baculiformis TaxID=2820812 RepID=A0ABS4AE59_9PROT|nr:hypothetical protein [Pararoseomonas baculiformis]MBP0444835.1 hypothetical protein [Pararoseomonas baculiformis]